jgi:hypothetical protein
MNGSKTSVMDVIGFPCVSLGSSTVHLHDSLGRRHACTCSEADLSSHNGDHAWGVCYQRAVFCFAFFSGQKDSVRRIFTKKCFLCMVGSVSHVKWFTIRKCGSLYISQPFGHPWPLTGIALPLFYLNLVLLQLKNHQ